MRSPRSVALPPLLALGLIGIVAVPTDAQQGSGRGSAASTAVERLAAFEGVWTDTLLPADRAFRVTCVWLAGGRRHVVCRTTAKSSAGSQEQLLILSYRNADSAYVAYSVLPTAQARVYTGQWTGDAWILNLVPPRPDASQRLRMIVTPRPGGIRFVEEASESGGAWRVTEDYTYTPVRGGG